MIEAIANAVQAGIVAALAKMLLSQYLGATLVMVSAVLAVVIMRKHVSTESKFTAGSAPGVIVSMMALGLMLFGMWLILSGYNPNEN